MSIPCKQSICEKILLIILFSLVHMLGQVNTPTQTRFEYYKSRAGESRSVDLARVQVVFRLPAQLLTGFHVLAYGAMRLADGAKWSRPKDDGRRTPADGTVRISGSPCKLKPSEICSSRVHDDGEMASLR